MSKHVVVSNDMMPTVVAAFASQPENMLAGRALYLYRRITFSELTWYPEPDYLPVEIDLKELPAH